MSAKPTEEAIRVFAASDPVVQCTFLVDQGDRTIAPYDLTGAQLEFYRKARSDEADNLPLYSTADGSIVVVDAMAGRASIQFDQHDIRYAGQFRYHVDAVRDGRRTVLGAGPLTVVDR